MKRIGAPMVQWLSPTGLLTTGVNVLLSGVFSRYADKRELVASVAREDLIDHSDEDVLWVDYVADTGDGWGSTFAVAWALCQAHDVAGEHTLPGRILVMGGDEVYPSADFDRYGEKLRAPYELAAQSLPLEQRTLLAVPGNHDWYDGLTAFMRMFSQGTSFAAWEAPQARSYFVARLPEHWWLMGVDIGFGSYLDAAQLRYFRQWRSECKIGEGDRIILCTGKPTWATRSLVGDERIRRHSKTTLLEEFESEIVLGWGCELPLVLSGDLHHYSRYEMDGGTRQRITAGGGGAYLFPTHGLQDPIAWPDPSGVGDEQGRLASSYPDKAASSRLRSGVLLSPARNPSFLALAAAIHLLVATQLVGGIHARAACADTNFVLTDRSTVEALAGVPISKFASAMFVRPLSGLVLAVLLLGLVAFADSASSWERAWMSSVHWLSHVALVACSMWLAVTGATIVFGLTICDEPSWWWKVAAFVLIGIGVFAFGALGSGFAFGAYLAIAEWRHRHANDAFAAMGIPDYKSFLRMRIGSGGALDVYSFRVPRAAERPRVTDVHDPYEPEDVTVELIEGPIRVWPRSDRMGE